MNHTLLIKIKKNNYDYIWPDQTSLCWLKDEFCSLSSSLSDSDIAAEVDWLLRLAKVGIIGKWIKANWKYEKKRHANKKGNDILAMILT